MVDLLMLRRRTKIDDLIDAVPKPPRAVPINALPGWENLPLSSKLPMLHCPRNSIIFSRDHLGKKLDNSSTVHFRLSNAFAQTAYEPLHDPNLRKFVFQEQNIDLLQKQGEITQYKDVVCTLKEFNEYRQFLNQARLELVNQLRAEMDSEAQDRLLFAKAQEMIEKNFRRKMQLVARQLNQEQLEMAAQEKLLARQAKKDQQVLNRKLEHENLMQVKQEIKQLREADFREKCRRVKDDFRIKIAKLKHTLRLQDIHRRRMLKKRHEEMAAEKEEEEIHQWYNVLQQRHERQIRNEDLLNKYEADMKQRIEKRIIKYELIRERVQHKILQTKVNLIRSRYENMELQRLLQVVTEEIHRKVKREKALELRSKLHDSSERAGLSPIVAPYRTPEESAQGLGDAPSGYNAIDDETIKLVVTTCSRNEKTLNGKNYTTMEVLLAAKYSFDRLAGGTTDDLPNDPDVLKFILIVVDSVISRVKERIYNAAVGMIKPDRKPSFDNPPKTKSTSTLNRNLNKSSKLSNIISFKDQCDKGNSKTKSLVLEKMTSLRTMVRSALETPPLHDDLQIPPELDDEKLFHLSQPQKALIVRNLHNLEIMLAIRLEQNVISRFDVQNLVIKPCRKKYHNCHDILESDLSDDVYNDLMARAMTSVLTKPEQDEEFPSTIVALSDYLAEKVLYDLKDFIESLDEASEEEEEEVGTDRTPSNELDLEYEGEAEGEEH